MRTMASLPGGSAPRREKDLMRAALVALAFLFVAPGALAESPSSAAPAFGFARELSGLGLSLLNAGLFCLPVLAWNIALSSKLNMARFAKKPPAWYEPCENVLRIAALAYPFARPLDPRSSLFVPGLCVFGVGAAVYFASWFPLMGGNPKAWQEKILIQLAPAYTPIVWLAGISLLANSPLELCLSGLFIAMHVGEYLLRWEQAVR